jgi:hypothetical protein
MATHEVSLFPLFLILFSCVFISVGLVFFVVQISPSGTILYPIIYNKYIICAIHLSL